MAKGTTYNMLGGAFDDRPVGSRKTWAEIGAEIDGDVEWMGEADSAKREAERVEQSRITFPAYGWPDPATLPKREFLMGHWFLRGALTTIAAAGGFGKSSCTAAMAVALVSGRPLLRKPVYGGPFRVLLWNLEDDLEEMSRQIAAAGLAHGITAADCGDRLFVASALGGLGLPPMALVTASQDDGNFKLHEEVFQKIEAAIQSHKIDVVIIDPFVSSHHARENETEHMDRIVKRMSLVAKRTNCSLAIVHHTRKTNGEKADADAVRGSGAIVNAARVVLVLNRMTPKEATDFNLADDDERRRLFSIDVGKANRSPPEAIEWFRFESVAIGNGDEVGAVVPWSAPDLIGDINQLQVIEAMGQIARGAWRSDPRAKEWVGHAIGPVIGQDSKSPAGRTVLRMVLSQWLSDGLIALVKRRDEGARKDFEFVQVVDRGEAFLDD